EVKASDGAIQAQRQDRRPQRVDRQEQCVDAVVGDGQPGQQQRRDDDRGPALESVGYDVNGGVAETKAVSDPEQGSGLFDGGRLSGLELQPFVSLQALGRFQGTWPALLMGRIPGSLRSRGPGPPP